MDTAGDSCGQTNLAGSMTRQSTLTKPLDAANDHLTNIGRMIEDMEIEVRSNMHSLYLQKTHQVVAEVRRSGGGGRQGKEFTSKLNEAVMEHGKGRKVDSES